jgi:uncharacterized protein
MKLADLPIIVMAKAPVAGFAKTRLIPALGPSGAAALAERLLRWTLEQARRAALGPIDLCCAPDAHHPAFERERRAGDVLLSQQGEGDLGARMARAFDRWLELSGQAVMIGTDAPALDAAMLRRAAQALLDTHADTDTRAETDAVFVPAHDGGYALIGLRRSVRTARPTWLPTLFEGMAWSTGSVMHHTRERLRAAGLRHTELPAVADIDEPADLMHLPAGWLS